ncbi:MAG TPA: sugar phosphate nucleotidyltransferase, partial [Actinomycetota bacterium]|nr:sugar phosphate nucleotidyltransferase [Actinomycetota bacterium]
MEDGPIQAVLLAAGRGKRLRPLSDLLPKPAMPVLDVPVATFALRGLADVFEHVVVNTNHLPDAVVARLA